MLTSRKSYLEEEKVVIKANPVSTPRGSKDSGELIKEEEELVTNF